MELEQAMQEVQQAQAMPCDARAEQLQRILDSSPSYTARYIAAKELQVPLVADIHAWIDTRCKELETDPDAIHDLDQLFSHLSESNYRFAVEIAYSSGPTRGVRMLAGRALGHTDHEIGAHEIDAEFRMLEDGNTEAVIDLYGRSEFLMVRYKAGKQLAVPSGQLRSDLELSVGTRWDLWRDTGEADPMQREDMARVFDSPDVDRRTREKAGEMVGYGHIDILANELSHGTLDSDEVRSVYDYGPARHERMEAGRMLGYGAARIRAHEMELCIRHVFGHRPS